MSKILATAILAVTMVASTAAMAQPVTWCVWPYVGPLCPYPYETPYYDDGGPYVYVPGPYVHRGPVFHGHDFHGGFHGGHRR